MYMHLVFVGVESIPLGNLHSQVHCHLLWFSQLTHYTYVLTSIRAVRIHIITIQF